MTLTRTLFLFAGLLLFCLPLQSVYPNGDDLMHLVFGRDFPVPLMYAWVGNRVVDAFFTGWSFSVFEIFYLALPDFVAPSDFLSLFRAGVSAFYAATALALLALILGQVRSAQTVPGSPVTQIAVFGLVLSAIIGWLPITDFHGFTHLFAYQITGVITLAFVLLAFPVDALEGGAEPGRRADANAEGPPSTSQAVHLAGTTLLAYFTSIGIEVFVIFAWIYITLYFAVAMSGYRRIGLRPTLAALIERHKNRLILTALFGVFTVASFLALATSGRTRAAMSGVTPGGTPLDEMTLGMALSMTGHALVALPMRPITFMVVVGVVLVVITLVVRLRLPLLRQEPDWPAFFQRQGFFYAVAAAYWLFLLAFSVTINTRYFLSGIFLVPTTFLLALSAAEIIYRCVATDRTLLVLSGSALLAATIFPAALKNEFDRMYERAERGIAITQAFERAATAQDNTVPVPFALPDEKGYPLLPGPAAENWFRHSYRVILNRHYGTEFDETGPVFVSQTTYKEMNSQGKAHE